MTDKIYLDANFIVASLIYDHPFHNHAVQKNEDLLNANLFTSFLVIDEIVYSLTKYNLPKESIKNLLTDHLLLIENLSLIREPTEIQSLNEYLKDWISFNLKPRDAMHHFLMKIEGIRNMATFDSDFIKNADKLGIKIV